MARPTETRISNMQQAPEVQRVGPEGVTARAVDTFVAPRQGEYNGLINGLAAFKPGLEKYLEVADQKDQTAGALARSTGQAKDEAKSSSWMNGYMRMDGAVSAQQDATSIEEDYRTKFNKDTGNIEQFISDQFASRTKGLTDPHYLEGYQKALSPHLDKLRQANLDYHKGQVTQKAESNAMFLIEQGARSFLDKGLPIPDSYIEQARTHLGTEMSVSNGRFNDLLFGAVKRLGDEGNYSVYDMFKRNRPDGTPGMYFIPAWKEKIDQAQVHAMKVFNEKHDRAEIQAKKDREDRQEKSVFGIIDQVLDGNEKGAQTSWDIYRKGGQITRASDLVKYDKLVHDTAKREATPAQQAHETTLLTGIYTRKQSYNDVIDSLNDGHINNTQAKSLLTEARKVINEDRANATAAAGQEKAIFKTPEFKYGAEYIDHTLRSGASPLDPMGVGTEFDRQLRAGAGLRFTQETKQATSAAEVNQVRDRIVSDARKAREQWTADIKKNPKAAGIRYFTLEDTLAAARKGLLTPREIDAHTVFLENLNQKP